jgi:hypothetical protein
MAMRPFCGYYMVDFWSDDEPLLASRTPSSPVACAEPEGVVAVLF